VGGETVVSHYNAKRLEAAMGLDPQIPHALHSMMNACPPLPRPACLAIFARFLMPLTLLSVREGSVCSLLKLKRSLTLKRPRCRFWSPRDLARLFMLSPQPPVDRKVIVIAGIDWRLSPGGQTVYRRGSRIDVRLNN